jgi:hypothetical protein
VAMPWFKPVKPVNRGCTPTLKFVPEVEGEPVVIHLWLFKSLFYQRLKNNWRRWNCESKPDAIRMHELQLLRSRKHKSSGIWHPICFLFQIETTPVSRNQRQRGQCVSVLSKVGRTILKLWFQVLNSVHGHI